MAAVLTNGKGFYHPLVYLLESHRLKLKFLPPSVNEPGPAFVPHGNAIRVPVTRVKGLTNRTMDAMLQARERGEFTSLANFFHRVAPAAEELEAMIRTGAFDEFGDTRTRQFWQAQHLVKTYSSNTAPDQGWLIAPAGVFAAGAAGAAGRKAQNFDTGRLQERRLNIQDVSIELSYGCLQGLEHRRVGFTHGFPRACVEVVLNDLAVLRRGEP
jgi:DNA polymerase III alpha subunit